MPAKHFKKIRHSCFYLILINFLFSPLNRSSMALSISTNTAGYVYPEKMQIINQIHETPYDNIFEAQNNMRRINNFNYTFCHPKINDYLTNKEEWGICDRCQMNDFFSFFNTTYYVLQNVYGNTHGSWAVNKTTLVSLPQEHYGLVLSPGWFEIQNESIKYIFDDVINIAHAHTRDHYGHFLADCLIPMLLLPEDVLQRSYVLGGSSPPFINDGLLTIGIRNEQIINVTFLEWFYAKRMHTFAGKRPSLSFFGYSCLNFNRIMTKKLNLNSIPPTKYFLQNRKQGNFRHIGNFGELIEDVRQKFSGIKWLILPDMIGNYSKTAQIWASARFVWAITGSNSINAVFMKPDTVVVLGMASIFERSSIGIICSSKHFTVLFPVPGMEMYAKNKQIAWKLNIPLANEAIERGLQIDALYQKKS